jgi:hypothetical protein
VSGVEATLQSLSYESEHIEISRLRDRDDETP